MKGWIRHAHPKQRRLLKLATPKHPKTVDWLRSNTKFSHGDQNGHSKWSFQKQTRHMAFAWRSTIRALGFRKSDGFDPIPEALFFESKSSCNRSVPFSLGTIPIPSDVATSASKTFSVLQSLKAFARPFLKPCGSCCHEKWSFCQGQELATGLSGIWAMGIQPLETAQ